MVWIIIIATKQTSQDVPEQKMEIFVERKKEETSTHNIQIEDDDAEVEFEQRQGKTNERENCASKCVSVSVCVAFWIQSRNQRGYLHNRY